MAIVIDTKIRNSVGSYFEVFFDLDFDSSYPTGGEAYTLGDFGFANGVVFGELETKGGYTFEFDRTNKKILVYAPYNSYTAAVNPASATTDTIQNVAVAVTGVATTDIIRAIPPNDLESGVVPITAWASATDEVTVRLANPTAGTVDGASKTWTFHAYGATGRQPVAATDLSALTNVRGRVIGR